MKSQATQRVSKKESASEISSVVFGVSMWHRDCCSTVEVKGIPCSMIEGVHLAMKSYVTRRVLMTQSGDEMADLVSRYLDVCDVARSVRVTCHAVCV